MATLNFDESIVLILFAQAIGDPTPSKAALVQFDAGLQSSFGTKLQNILTDEGMNPDKHNRSAVLGCRPHMSGNTSDTQIRNACRYVMHAQQQLGEPAIGGPLMAAAPKKAKGAKKAGKKKTAKTGKKAKKKPSQ